MRLKLITLAMSLSLCAYTISSTGMPLVTGYIISGVQNGQCTVSGIDHAIGLSSPEITFPDDSGTEAMCVAAYSSVQKMVSTVNGLLGLSAGVQPQGGFTFYVTSPDLTNDPTNDLTTADCGTTAAEGGPALCSLLVYATDIGIPGVSGSRDFSAYFTSLLTDEPVFTGNFQSSGQYDFLVEGLGEGTAPSSTSGGVTSFYNQVTGSDLNIPYYADTVNKTPLYGLSGGGGSGWGAELKVPGKQSSSFVTLLSFGGGGGGGMTQNINDPETNLYAGSGGGGGMQFASGFVYKNQSQNHLGLGAGVGTSFIVQSLPAPNLVLDPVQYSYSNINGCTTHDTDSAGAQEVLSNYSNMLVQLKAYLLANYNHSVPLVLVGGGGMGGGMEYMQNNGQEAPNLISTQGGFSFQYVFQSKNQAMPSSLQNTDPLDQLYSVMGGVYQTVNAGAVAQCGYENYACTCAYNQINIPVLASKASGIPVNQLPSWLSNQYCPVTIPAPVSAPVSASNDLSCVNPSGLTAYQQALLDEVSAGLKVPASNTLDELDGLNGLSSMEIISNASLYFNAMNAQNPNAIDLAPESAPESAPINGP